MKVYVMLDGNNKPAAVRLDPQAVLDAALAWTVPDILSDDERANTDPTTISVRFNTKGNVEQLIGSYVYGRITVMVMDTNAPFKDI